MKIKFKNGKEIEFKQFGEVWLAESVIWEKTELHSSLVALRKLKAKVTRWFEENAPEEILTKYKVRLPLWEEIKPLPFKDQVAYKEGRTDQVADYLLGDEDCSYPLYCSHFAGSGRCGFYRDPDNYPNISYAIRLCLEELK